MFTKLEDRFFIKYFKNFLENFENWNFCDFLVVKIGTFWRKTIFSKNALNLIEESIQGLFIESGTYI